MWKSVLQDRVNTSGRVKRLGRFSSEFVGITHIPYNGTFSGSVDDLIQPDEQHARLLQGPFLVHQCVQELGHDVEGVQVQLADNGRNIVHLDAGQNLKHALQKHLTHVFTGSVWRMLDGRRQGTSNVHALDGATDMLAQGLHVRCTGIALLAR